MKLKPLYQESNEFATPFPELGKTGATHFESASSTNSNTPADIFLYTQTSAPPEFGGIRRRDVKDR